MATLSDTQMAGYLKAAGFPTTELGTGVAVGLAESGGRTDASHQNSNGTVDKGFMQINSIHNVQGDLFDPMVNAIAAYKIWHDAGNAWTPWSVFNSKSYLVYKARGDSAAKAPVAPAGNIPVPSTGNPAGTDIAASTSVIDKLSMGSFWLRVGAFFLGLVLLIMGLMQLMGVSKTIGQLAKTAIKVGEVAA